MAASLTAASELDNLGLADAIIGHAREFSSRTGDSLILRVQDNGTGITLAQVADPKTMGLVQMRQLALSFGGKFGIEGTLEKGTTVSVEIPLDAQV
jgi:signal transduction histidine kinase